VQQFFTGAVDITSKGFKGLKLAIAGTGIGLLVIAVGTLISNFDTVKKVVFSFVPQLEKVVFKGKEQWDGTRQSAWLEDYILKHVASKIDSTAKSGSSESSEGEDGGSVPF